MGAVFSKPKAPKIEANAPAIEQVPADPVAPELGVKESTAEKKKKGKKGLKIDLKSGTGSGTGANKP